MVYICYSIYFEGIEVNPESWTQLKGSLQGCHCDFLTQKMLKDTDSHARFSKNRVMILR